MKYVIRYVKPHIPTMIFGFTLKSPAPSWI